MKRIPPEKPNFPLPAVQAAVSKGHMSLVPENIIRDAIRLKLDALDIRDCFAALSDSDFYKPDTARTYPKPGDLLDIYYVTFQRRRIYLKFHYDERSDWVYVTSFKRNERS